MTTASHTRSIESPAAETWRAIADYAHVDAYHPAVERVSILPTMKYWLANTHSLEELRTLAATHRPRSRPWPGL